MPKGLTFPGRRRLPIELNLARFSSFGLGIKIIQGNLDVFFSFSESKNPVPLSTGTESFNRECQTSPFRRTVLSHETRATNSSSCEEDDKLTHEAETQYRSWMTISLTTTARVGQLRIAGKFIILTKSPVPSQVMAHTKTSEMHVGNRRENVA